MLLANVSVSEAGARKLLQIDGEQLQGLHVRRLVRWYLENKPDEKIFPGIEWTEAHFKEIDPWQYVANILANVTQVRADSDLLTLFGLLPASFFAVSWLNCVEAYPALLCFNRYFMLPLLSLCDFCSHHFAS